MGYTCVPNNPQRVVTLSPLALGNALVLGIKPIGSNNLVYWGERLPTYLGNKTEGIETLGTEEQSNLEKILSLKPDLIVGNNLYHEAIYPLLSNIAPTALHHFQGNIIWRDVFNFMAEVLGKQDIAQRTWNRYYQRIEELKLALGDRYQDKTISVSWFYFGRIGSNVKNSFDGSILNDVGLKRPASQDVTTDYGYIDFSEEELEKSDGDVMFVMSFTDNDEQALKQLQQRPLWNQLKAVQQNQVYFVDQLTWTGGNLLAADAVIDDLYKYLVNTP
ncbi:ABC transporter substrate-binding protein [Gloeocapsopsis sp. IPPAS B-1203]|nr:ABC transporter substrate-binding protein [Gloeocapsopsis sp. IPPAS B-1203]